MTFLLFMLCNQQLVLLAHSVIQDVDSSSLSSMHIKSSFQDRRVTVNIKLMNGNHLKCIFIES